jgi:hypothetical protein
MGGSIGFFGRYTVDEDEEFSGNRVEGSTFSNWIGSVWTRQELRLTVTGAQMVEDFRRPGGGGNSHRLARGQIRHPVAQRSGCTVVYALGFDPTQPRGTRRVAGHALEGAAEGGL